MGKQKQKVVDTTDHFPEYTTPQFGERVVSFAVRDVNGQKRTVYIRDENGYPYQGKQKVKGK